MTGKEKLQKALHHEEAPLLLDIGGFPTTGIHCSMVEKLRDYYGLEKRPVVIAEPMQMLGLVEDDLKAALGVQTTTLDGEYNIYGFTQDHFKEFKTPWGQVVLVPGDFNTDMSDRGDVMLYARGDRNYPPVARMPASGYFFDGVPRGQDFDPDEYDYRDNCEEFGPIPESSLRHLEKKRAELEHTTNAVLGNLGSTAFGDIAMVPGPSLPNPKGIRDIEEWYISTVIRQDELHRIFDCELEWALHNLEKMASVLGDTIQVAYICGNDFGTQKGPFCSTELFESLYAPYYKAVNDWIHTHTSWATFKHSCGGIMPLIPGLLEAGFDCLNPVQWTAEGMARQELKNRFGDRVVFWGGGIDTQKVLPFGTPQQVYDQTLECCRIFGKGGGFVFNTIHNIQAMTPVENLVAMLNAVHHYNGEKIPG